MTLIARACTLYLHLHHYVLILNHGKVVSVISESHKGFTLLVKFKIGLEVQVSFWEKVHYKKP